MTPPTLMVALTLLSTSYAVENLDLVYQWKMVDFEYPSPEAKQNAINSGEYVVENNLPLGMEIYGDRLFVTVPRWKSGVAASLTYIDLKDKSESPILRPYPNWAAHNLPADGKAPEIVSPFRVRADRCGRLWVLDTCVLGILDKHQVYSPARVLIYDLRTDALLRAYQIPPNQVIEDSFLANLVVEDVDCDDAYGYFGDLGYPGVVVYSFKMNSSWRIKHHYFHYDPMFVEFHVAGGTFTWPDGIFGMGLTAPGSDGISTLYFHPMAGTSEFAVSTRHLRNASNADTNFHKFRVVGSRGPNGQSSVQFLDQKSGVLFYALVTQNAIGCWNTANPTYTLENQGQIYQNNETMIFPNDIKVDRDDNIWVLSDRLPIFIYAKLNASDFNFRIFKAPLSDAVRNTACDPNASSAEIESKFQSSTAQAPVVQDLSSIFSNFKPPTTDPSMVAVQEGNKRRPPVQAFAVAEIPDSLNKFPPPQPLNIPGNPDLSFMYRPSGSHVFNSFQPPSRVPVQSSMVMDEDDNGKKGFEFLINVPVNLYISVENP